MFLESVSGLLEAGEEVLAVVPSAGPLTEQFDRLGVAWRTLPMPVLRKSALTPGGFARLAATALRSAPSILGLLARVRPRVVYVSTQTIPSVLIAARLSGARTVCHIHEAERHPRRAVELGLFGPLRAAHELIANSEYSAMVVGGAVPALAERTRVITNGVAGPPTVTAPRERLVDGVRVLYIGRISPRKGPDVAIRAVRSLREKGVRVSLDLVGDTFAGYEWFAEHLQDDAGDLIGSGDVRLHGFRPSVWDAIADSDIVVVPSVLPESLGNTAVEARLAARPVVVSEIGGLVEAIAGSASSHAVPPGDHEALADALHHVIDEWPSVREAALADARSAEGTFAPQRYRREVAAALSERGSDATPERPLRVMQSFPQPRPTTNPYIVQLGQALQADPGVEHVTFSWREAVRGRFDVVHLHWPEALIDGGGVKGIAKRALYAAFLARCAVRRTALVQTVHNLALPDVPWSQRILLQRTAAMTDLRIVINPTTTLPEGDHFVTILHGHYRDWFAAYPRKDPVPGRAAFVGLIRRYKGVEDLVEVMRRSERTDLSLTISGNPTSSEIEQAIRESVAPDPRVSVDLRYLDDADFVAAITAAQLIVLPYRHMHNSGTALAALSLDRPVLVPVNDATQALAAEVGPGWVHFYSGHLTVDALERALAAPTPSNPPDLSAREWGGAGLAHREAYRLARRLALGRSDAGGGSSWSG